MSAEGRSLSLLLDTNVWLDYFLPIRPGAEQAFELVTTAKGKGAALLYCAHALSDMFYVLCRAQKAAIRKQGGSIDEGTVRAINEYAWGCIDALADRAVGLPTDVRTIWMAQRFKPLHRDFEDCLVLGACELAEVDFLVTSDEKLRSRATVAALSPADMTSYLSAH